MKESAPRRDVSGDLDEVRRLDASRRRERNWKRWGPYLAERQWGTVREDYSDDQQAWRYFVHDQARSRAYRWGEDGLLGLCDRQCRLAFALALWNGHDPFLKERLFGVTSDEGNHGEDVKECYWYLDATPTHSYLRSAYRYPQAEYPYAELVAENRRRGRDAPEFELEETGVLDDGRYWDVQAEYAKADPDDIAILISVTNHGPEPARLHVLPTLWFRNFWSWGRHGEGYGARPRIRLAPDGGMITEHPQLDRFRLTAAAGPDGGTPDILFTENETNVKRLFGTRIGNPYSKDAFHEYVVSDRRGAVNPAREGSKAAFHYVINTPAGGTVQLRLRLTGPEAASVDDPLGAGHDATFEARRREADAYYASIVPATLDPEEVRVTRQAYAGLLHGEQFYHYVVKDWLEGDATQPPPPPSRRHGRNYDWTHLYSRDVISMPDKWEYPWFAAWDLAFHAIPLARVDPDFAKSQLVLFLREWYMHPNGALPAYEWAFNDANPPVHAWAAWRVYKMTADRGRRDRRFLAGIFQKLLINFTWWVNRKDVAGENLFSGGFLGLDNIGVFDRSSPMPWGGSLDQADGTAWMAFYCSTMLSIGLELAREDPVYEDVASKFFEHFVAIVDAMNQLDGGGLWDEEDGFYYDRLHMDGRTIPLRIRSLVGLIPLLAVEVLQKEAIAKLPGFQKRLEWFLANRPDLAQHISYFDCSPSGGGGGSARLLAIPSRERLVRVLRYLLDEEEFLSPYGVRSLSKYHAAHPFVLSQDGQEHSVAYAPGEADSPMFGGNSNWRGPVWLPVNFLLVEALERYHHFYGDSLEVECPTGSGRMVNLGEAAKEILRRMTRLFLPGPGGVRPCEGESPHAGARSPDRVLYHEYFHAETGQGLGASHQTGWTALAATCLEKLAKDG